MLSIGAQRNESASSVWPVGCRFAASGREGFSCISVAGLAGTSGQAALPVRIFAACPCQPPFFPCNEMHGLSPCSDRPKSLLARGLGCAAHRGKVANSSSDAPAYTSQMVTACERTGFVGGSRGALASAGCLHEPGSSS